MKYILIIGDGMADDSLPELSDMSPLEYASTPALDNLASNGTIGNVLTIPEGLPPGSDTAILSIFGCDPAVYYTGRASLEAAASGIKLNTGDIAYRCNMVTLSDEGEQFENKKIISHSAGGINAGAADALVTALFDAPTFKKAAAAAQMSIYPGGSYRHIAVQKFTQCQGIKNAGTLTPPHDHLGEVISALLPQGQNAKTLTELTKMSFDILREHKLNIKRRAEGKLPANSIWFWANSEAAALPGFYDKYGKTGCVISAVPLCQGIGVLMGLTKVIVQGATGELNTNYEGKADAAFEALKTNDFAAVHIEAPDECTHDGDLKGKLQAIEWIDSRVVAPLVKKFKDSKTDIRMLIMSDHKTLMKTRGHAGGPVPYILYDSRYDKNTKRRFSESNALNGDYIDNGTELMKRLFDDT